MTLLSEAGRSHLLAVFIPDLQHKSANCSAHKAELGAWKLQEGMQRQNQQAVLESEGSCAAWHSATSVHVCRKLLTA